MEIYCGNCDQNIGLQTNEDFNKMFAENTKLQAENKQLRNTFLFWETDIKKAISRADKIDKLETLLKEAMPVMEKFYLRKKFFDEVNKLLDKPEIQEIIKDEK